MESEPENVGSVVRLPGLINVPILGNIIIALTPRIVPDVTR